MGVIVPLGILTVVAIPSSTGGSGSGMDELSETAESGRTMRAGDCSTGEDASAVGLELWSG